MIKYPGKKYTTDDNDENNFKSLHINGFFEFVSLGKNSIMQKDYLNIKFTHK